jgi:glyoxylase-like metal-dependent hydrolase (beta-lactamase superfamily II)
MTGDLEQDSARLIPSEGRWDERVLVCRCAPTVDSFIVVTARHVVVVDTLLGPATAGALLDLARPHLRDGRSLLVVNTHADWDHCWGNGVFAGPGAALPAPIIATRACAARFRDGELAATLAERRAEEPGRFDGVRLTPPTLLFDELLTIDGGDLTLELFGAPGHTADHLAIFIPEIATLLAGDAAEFPFPFAASAEALPQIRATLARLAALNPRVALYCHAPEGGGPALIAQNIAYFDGLEARCRAALARGVTAGVAPEKAEEAVGFPFAEALPPGTDSTALPDMYRNGHREHLRMMLAWLASSGEGTR